MPRRTTRKNRRTPRPGQDGRLGARAVLGRETEEGPDGDWIVLSLAGQNAAKAYRCPGCDQLIPSGTPHVVAWRDGDADDRRHWHRPCWNARGRRAPTRRR